MLEDLGISWQIIQNNEACKIKRHLWRIIADLREKNSIASEEKIKEYSDSRSVA